MELSHTASTSVLLVPRIRYHSVCVCAHSWVRWCTPFFYALKFFFVESSNCPFHFFYFYFLVSYPFMSPVSSAGKINTSSSSTSFSPPPTHTPKTHLMSSSFVLRMADFSIYQVTTTNCPQLFTCEIHKFAHVFTCSL